MTWDGDKINDFFIRLFEKKNPERYAYKPKNELFDNLHDIELAYQDLYRTCAENAWTKERLLNALENIISSDSINNKAKDSEKYLETIVNGAKKIKESIENDSLHTYAP
jgi:hypothetical protein